MIDASNADFNGIIQFVFVLAGIGLAGFGALMVKQTGQMIEVLPSALSPLIRLLAWGYLIACLIAVAVFLLIM